MKWLNRRKKLPLPPLTARPKILSPSSVFIFAHTFTIFLLPPLTSTNSKIICRCISLVPFPLSSFFYTIDDSYEPSGIPYALPPLRRTRRPESLSLPPVYLAASGVPDHLKRWKKEQKRVGQKWKWLKNIITSTTSTNAASLFLFPPFPFSQFHRFLDNQEWWLLGSNRRGPMRASPVNWLS